MSRFRIVQAGPRELAWLSHYSDAELTPAAVGIAAVDRNGRVRGVVAFDHFDGTTCRIHTASAPLAARALVPACFHAAFEVLGMERLLAPVSSLNARSLRLVRHLGFLETRREVDGFGKGNHVVWHEIRREDCRWMPRRKAA